ncbi:DNA-binding transcriptional MerR regulator [Kineococcus xinjiangensis]|uniref:DNA-binding transcriptional MerR regulator n=1 Tax=Kineococcus xinjiangensis TaxID=512762 RepID=A0A2S6IUD5_9ACTN|nr:MerR family transcriptional regulator [Kineococcus xinjiangensis]PPK97887.1 DNA-binding transcriptional MerR regulator [Kineococcus xinjiangensis]
MTTTATTTAATAGEEGLGVAEAAQLCGLTAHTLRYYERDGLLVAPVRRTASGHRSYTAADLRWITMVTRLRATGMPIREIRTYAELCRRGGHEEERLAILHAHRERVRAQLAEVQGHLGAIDRKIDLYEQHLAAR